MITKWKDCTDPEELFRLKREGWEIEYCTVYGGWAKWNAATWNEGVVYRIRQPQQKTKTITLRKALMKDSIGQHYTTEQEQDMSKWPDFVRWIGEPYRVEVP